MHSLTAYQLESAAPGRSAQFAAGSKLEARAGRLKLTLKSRIRRRRAEVDMIYESTEASSCGTVDR